jgi:tetratricopeptide (TPR) repeat protein
MKWLESPQNEAERLLHEGFVQATRRTGDEITHRRVWAKIVEAAEAPQPRYLGRFLLAGAAIVLLASAGVLAYPHLSSFFNTTSKPVVQNGVPPTTQSDPSIVTAEPVSPAPSQLIEAERRPGQVVRTRTGEKIRVALGGGAEAELAENSAINWDNQHRPSIEAGIAKLSVPHQPPGWRFSVTAGPYIVTVVGTKFEVQVVDRTVGVEVTEGVVEVWRGSRSTRLVAGDSWHGPLYPEESQPSVAPAASAPSKHKAVHHTAPAAASLTNRPMAPLTLAVQEAQASLQAGDINKALDILAKAAQGNGPSAENASYELARITRYNLNRPRQAAALWDKYRTRFPSGLLRTEADLSIVETLSQMGDIREALAEADAFLARHPKSERRFEVQRLAERLRAAESITNQK